MKLDIKDLRDTPRHLRTISKWHQKEWGHLYPGSTLETRRKWMKKQYMTKKKVLVPSTFVALDGNKLAGSAAILQHDMVDMKELQDLRPWLASVYTKPDYRGKGVAQQLIYHVMMELIKDGYYKHMYLFTENAAGYYARMGFEKYRAMLYHNDAVNIMRIEL